MSAPPFQSKSENSLRTLQQAIRAGYRDVKKLREDTDFEPLRANEQFKGLVAELEKKSASGSAKK